MSRSFPSLTSSNTYRVNSLKLGGIRIRWRKREGLMWRYFMSILLPNLSWGEFRNAPLILSRYAEMNRSNGFLAIKNPIEFGEDRADNSFSTDGRGYFLRASVTGGIFRDLKTVLLYPAYWLKIWSQLKYKTSIRMDDYYFQWLRFWYE